MNCKSCKNYEPKASKPTTTVTVWMKAATGTLNGLLKHVRWACDMDVYVGQYSFSDTPDVDRVIHKTLGQGALAIKVECNERFCTEYVRHGSPSQYCVYLWKKEISTNGFYGWEDNNIPELRGSFCTADACVEQAITEYLAKQEPEIKVGDIVFVLPCSNNPALVIPDESLRPNTINNRMVMFTNGYNEPFRINDLRKATPDEVHEWFTRAVGKNKFIAYSCGNGVNTLFCLYDGTEQKVLSTKYEKCSPIIMQFIEDHNIPIMPYAWLQAIGGEMRYPV